LKKTRSNAERDISLGEEILLDVGRSKTVLVKVVRVELEFNEASGSVGQTVVVKPICSQYAGEFMEYKLSTAEFFEARTFIQTI
jgi:hypothetical protein